MRFQDEAGQVNQLIEFTESNGYETRIFDLELIKGKKMLPLFSCQAASLILPGFNLNRKIGGRNIPVSDFFYFLW